MSTQSSPDIEEIVLEKGFTGLGFNIRGGMDNHHVVGDPGIFVTTVRVDGAAAKDGRLQPGDKVLEIDGFDLRNVPHSAAVKRFHETKEKVVLLVEREAEQRILREEEEKRKSKAAANVRPNPVQNQDHTANLQDSWQQIQYFVIIGGGLLGVAVLGYFGYRKYSTGKFF